MANFQKVLEKYINLTYPDLLELAKKNISKLYPYFCSIAKDGDGIGLMFMGGCLASSGEFSYLEKKLMRNLFGDAINLFTRRAVAKDSNKQEYIDIANIVYNNCPSDLIDSLRSLALCFLAVDEHNDYEKNAFVHKLLN